MRLGGERLSRCPGRESAAKLESRLEGRLHVASESGPLRERPSSRPSDPGILQLRGRKGSPFGPFFLYDVRVRLAAKPGEFEAVKIIGSPFRPLFLDGLRCRLAADPVEFESVKIKLLLESCGGSAELIKSAPRFNPGTWGGEEDLKPESPSL